jgi:hypothetical protein
MTKRMCDVYEHTDSCSGLYRKRKRLPKLHGNNSEKYQYLFGWPVLSAASAPRIPVESFEILTVHFGSWR